MRAVAQLLVGPPMPDRSKVMIQTERSCRLGVGREDNNLTSEQNLIFDKPNIIMNTGWIMVVKDQGNVIRTVISIILYGMYSVCIEQEC
jgi:Ca2+/Na+ antiporter